MTRSFRRAAGLALLVVSAACSASSTAAPPSPSPVAATAGCAAAEARQFDFWVGSWKGAWTDAQGPTTASDVIVNTGCEIDETFTASRFLQHTNYSATSRSRSEPALARWVQDYSDSVGERSRWLGGFTNGAMTLVGPQVGSRQQRIMWRDIRPNGWTWEYDSSTDGTNWSALLVVLYSRAQ